MNNEKNNDINEKQTNVISNQLDCQANANNTKKQTLKPQTNVLNEEKINIEKEKKEENLKLNQPYSNENNRKGIAVDANNQIIIETENQKKEKKKKRKAEKKQKKKRKLKDKNE